MAVVSQVNTPKWRRKMSNATWLSDMFHLQKTIALCRGCATWKLPWRWQKTYHYQEIRRYHGTGYCDLCRQHEDVSLYECTDTPHFAAMDEDRRHYERARKQQQQAFAVTDSRRVR